MPSFDNQKKKVHDNKTEEGDGQSKGISIHVYSLDGARAEQDVECRDFLSCLLFWNRWNHCIEPHRQHGGLYLSNLLISQFARLTHDYMHEVNKSLLIYVSALE